MDRRRFGLLGLLWIGGALAQGKLPTPSAPRIPKPGAKDMCPVCGMLVAKYPHWVATIVYQDGHAHFFDGAKDMFKFYHDPPKYAPGHARAQMVSLWVTEYYTVQPIEAQRAHYVIGSDVLGPMGHEFVPLATRADAEAFLREHKGKRILRFEEVTPELPAKLDAGRF
ncbi:MAG: nitrous oxide reductase accessory protein NosL [Rhodocyclaceae bacterium]|nr:nitrous oxide reductase accessory protein NosL [Rhodocyclaceae bacterium]